MPMSIIKVVANCYNLSAASQIVPQPQRSVDQFQFKKIVSAAVVCIQN